MTPTELINKENAEQKQRFVGNHRYQKPPYPADWPCYYCYLMDAAKSNGVDPDEVCKLCIHNMDWQPPEGDNR